MCVDVQVLEERISSMVCIDCKNVMWIQKVVLP